MKRTSSIRIYDVDIPIPAFQRGWLHSRKLSLPWDVERISRTLGGKCWFSRYHRENRNTDPKDLRFRLLAIAGFWPSGGFVEVELGYANPLDSHPSGKLGVHAKSPSRAED